MHYQVIRSARRKSIALQVKKGQLIVRTPVFVSAEYIEKLVLSKQSWIEAKLLQSTSIAPKKIEFVNGSSLTWLGQPTTLQIELASRAKAQADCNKMVVQLSRYWYSHPDPIKKQLKIKLLIEAYAKKCAQTYIEQYLPAWSRITNLVPKSSTIKKYRARWGSCNNRGELQFNYMLMQAPSWVFDYVIVHELCHLRYLNHSANFWQLVATNFPNYLEAKQWLKSHQTELSWE